LASEANTLSTELRALLCQCSAGGTTSIIRGFAATLRRGRDDAVSEDFMSASQHDDQQDLPHEGPIKTPRQLVLAVIFAFVVPVIAIVLLVKYVTSAPQLASGSDGLAPDAVAQRIRPIGSVVLKDLANPAALRTGEQVYAAQCSACHGAGLAGSPKLGDEAAWAPRIKTGYDTLLASALKGKGAMVAQGGGDFADVEVGRAVVYMASKAGARFDEPKLPAAPAAAAPTPVAATAAAAEPTAAAPSPAAMPAPAATVPNAEAAPALYAQICAACHAAGVAGAPKFGDKAAWAPRLAQGVDGLTASAIKGKNAMPPRGGSAGSDADIKAVVAYMVNAVK
jgi:cytochrome c5